MERGRTALVVTDPQNDFLSPEGVAWSVVGKNVEANNTVENIETLFKMANAVWTTEEAEEAMQAK